MTSYGVFVSLTMAPSGKGEMTVTLILQYHLRTET